MSELGTIRKREDGSFEILVQVERSGFQTWMPAATFLSKYRTMEITREDGIVTMYDALILEGWTPPPAATMYSAQVESTRAFLGRVAARDFTA